jgi:hypothetical protein
MADFVRLLVDAAAAVVVMGIAAVIAGFAVAGVSGDTGLSLEVAGGAFVLTGAALLVRLWLLTRGVAPIPPAGPAA